MTIEEMKKRKQELGYTVEKISALSGVPLGTVRKVFSGQTKSPRESTIRKLSAVFQDSSADFLSQLRPHDLAVIARAEGLGESRLVYGSEAFSDEMMQDPLPFGKKQGEYTIDDYFALPDDKRYELIDGVIYEMASPSRDHQVIAGYLFFQLMTCAAQHPSAWHPYIAPLDVQLDKDEWTMVQPDVIVCCDPEQDSGQRIFGAPDFLAEVVSPSSVWRDRFIKFSKYKYAGVREYWRIEPKRQQVIVIRFEKDDETSIYSFDDEIPVGISDGECTVCFRPVKDQLTKTPHNDETAGE